MCILPYMNMWRGTWRAFILIGKRFRAGFLSPLSICALDSTNLFIILQVTGLPPPKKHLMLSQLPLRELGKPWQHWNQVNLESCWALPDPQSAEHERIWSRSPDSCSSSMLFAMRHILLLSHKNAALLLFQSCKGRNQHASSCCFFQRLFFNLEKKGQVWFVFFFFPSVKHYSISCWCTNQHKLSWVNRLHVISSKRGNPWGFSLCPTGAQLEPPRSHCIICRGEGWADTGRKELCTAEDQVVQLEVVYWGPPADGWSCSSYWSLSHFHGGVEQELILGKAFLGMRRKGLTNGQCN